MGSAKGTFRGPRTLILRSVTVAAMASVSAGVLPLLSACIMVKSEIAMATESLRNVSEELQGGWGSALLASLTLPSLMPPTLPPPQPRKRTLVCCPHRSFLRISPEELLAVPLSLDLSLRLHSFAPRQFLIKAVVIHSLVCRALAKQLTLPLPTDCAFSSRYCHLATGLKITGKGTYRSPILAGQQFDGRQLCWCRDSLRQPCQ